MPSKIPAASAATMSIPFMTIKRIPTVRVKTHGYILSPTKPHTLASRNKFKPNLFIPIFKQNIIGVWVGTCSYFSTDVQSCSGNRSRNARQWYVRPRDINPLLLLLSPVWSHLPCNIKRTLTTAHAVLVRANLTGQDRKKDKKRGKEEDGKIKEGRKEGPRVDVRTKHDKARWISDNTSYIRGVVTGGRVEENLSGSDLHTAPWAMHNKTAWCWVRTFLCLKFIILTTTQLTFVTLHVSSDGLIVCARSPHETTTIGGLWVTTTRIHVWWHEF